VRRELRVEIGEVVWVRKKRFLWIVRVEIGKIQPSTLDSPLSILVLLA
jgi:hypothetical protein